MERVISTSRLSKTQRETHSEIERKRRERMKRDTEFLRKQLANPHCKDKLSIFQAGAERLIQYTDKLGKRDYIINDEEYSHIIMSNFDGFSIHIRCSDGLIFAVHENVEKILNLKVKEIVGRTIQDLAEPGACTKQLINDVFHCSEFQWEVFNGLASRNFILALRCGPGVAAQHCIYGSDGGRYRFVEFCGDLSRQTDDTCDPNHTTVSFRGLCRPLDPVCGTVHESKHFTLRLSPHGFRVTEVVGDFEDLLGYGADRLLHKQLLDICVPSECDSMGRMLEEAQRHGQVTGSIHMIHGESSQPLLFDIHLSAIRLGSYLHCIVCRLNHHRKFGLTDSLEPNTGNGCPFNQTPTTVPTENTLTNSTEYTLRPTKAEDERCSNELPVHVADQPTQSQAPMDGLTDAPSCESVFSHPSGSNYEHTAGWTQPHPGCPEDDWFKNVDTSSFQNLLNSDPIPSPDCY